MKRCICLPILLLAITFCRGQEAVAEIDPAAAGIHDPKELEVFLDGVMNAHFETYHLAGAVIAVVKDGELFFTKGYGYSCLLYTSPSPRDLSTSRMPSSA